MVVQRGQGALLPYHQQQGAENIRNGVRTWHLCCSVALLPRPHGCKAASPNHNKAIVAHMKTANAPRKANQRPE